MPAAHGAALDGPHHEKGPAVAVMTDRTIVSPKHWGQCHDHRLEGSTMKYTKTIALGTAIAWAITTSGAVMPARHLP